VSRTRLVHLEDLLGRKVVAQDGQAVGRVEEEQAQRHGGDHEATEFLIGGGALLERWSIVRRLFRSHDRTIVARWDQIDISRPRKPRLTCAVEDLAVEHARAR